MPTYDYECKSCKTVFEAFQKISDEPLKTCPVCGKAVRRLIGGGTGIIFKGSGFYSTDHKKSTVAAASEPVSSPASEPTAEVATKQPDKTDGKAARTAKTVA